MAAVPHDLAGVLVGAVALGAIHGVEPSHGWPVAASYALDRSNKWVYGLAASLLIGVGHLISSIAMVAVFFYATAYVDLAQANQPISVLGGLQIGGPVSIVAGLLLVGLGVREYRHGHSHAGSHDHAHDHGHGHGSGGHQHDHGPAEHDNGVAGGLVARLRGILPSVGQSDPNAAADRGLIGIAWFAFLLGFAHEEEFEIIALCAGSNFCLELMVAYALTVIVGIVGLTLLLIAGYEHFEAQVERYTPYLPAFSAAVLVVMGLGFVTGVL